MRVIAGSARGRTLATFAGHAIRPTPDRVREALFSILSSRCGPWDGCPVLDLFAGSGALGIEALSRGAGHAWFIDSAAQAAATICDNLTRCRLAERATVLRRDVWSALAELQPPAPFALIFADPPYSQDHGPRLLQAIAQTGLLAGDGIFCLETAPADPVPAECGTLQMIDERRYGSTLLRFYQHVPAEER